MLDLTKIEHEIITDHQRRHAAAKAHSDQLYALELALALALEEAAGIIVSQLTIFEKYGFFPVVNINGGAVTASIEIKLMPHNNSRGFFSQLQTIYQPVDAKYVEFSTYVQNQNNWAYIRIKRDPQELAASFTKEHRGDLEHALTTVITA